VQEFHHQLDTFSMARHIAREKREREREEERGKRKRGGWCLLGSSEKCVIFTWG
jgi:hypothetical protein